MLTEVSVPLPRKKFEEIFCYPRKNKTLQSGLSVADSWTISTTSEFELSSSLLVPEALCTGLIHVDIISSVDVEGSETASKSSSRLFSCKFPCVIFVKPKLLSFGTFKAAAWSFASRCLLHRFLFGIFHSSLVITILGYSLHVMQKMIPYCILKTSKSSLCLHKKCEFKTFSVSTSVSTVHLKFL